MNKISFSLKLRVGVLLHFDAKIGLCQENKIIYTKERLSDKNSFNLFTTSGLALRLTSRGEGEMAYPLEISLKRGKNVCKLVVSQILGHLSFTISLIPMMTFEIYVTHPTKHLKKPFCHLDRQF